MEKLHKVAHLCLFDVREKEGMSEIPSNIFPVSPEVAQEACNKSIAGHV